jgi:aerobic carbon-monoxide dehydrogenase small subunit
MEVTIQFRVNGNPVEVATDTDRSLLDVLREDLGLTGVKCGCGEGQCGACSVLVEGERVLSCTIPARRISDKTIITIEGLVTDKTLHPVQEAFLAEGAMQCGYCTPGMVLTAVGLLMKNPKPTDAEIVQAMDGNICRCNGYLKIHKAIRRAATMLAEGTKQ